MRVVARVVGGHAPDLEEEDRSSRAVPWADEEESSCILEKK